MGKTEMSEKKATLKHGAFGGAGENFDVEIFPLSKGGRANASRAFGSAGLHCSLVQNIRLMGSAHVGREPFGTTADVSTMLGFQAAVCRFSPRRPQRLEPSFWRAV
jgi:hypothetical protein